jgi:hypothetical protein
MLPILFFGDMLKNDFNVVFGDMFFLVDIFEFCMVSVEREGVSSRY